MRFWLEHSSEWENTPNLIKLPVFWNFYKGDVKYEIVYEWNGRIYDGHELDAESLSFEHLVTGVPIVFRAPLPSWAI